VRRFVLHTLIAVLWMFLWGSFKLTTLIAGYIVAYLLLAIIGRRAAALGEFPRAWRAIRFIFYFIRILVVANWQVARLVLDPKMPIHPRIIRYDVSKLTPTQLTTFSSSITLTPGTLSTDLSPDRRWLYVHCINAADRAAAIADLDELQRRLLKGLFS